MTKPLLLVDVDGVLNVLWEREGLERHVARGFTILTSRDFGSWLLSLADVFELAWATTWVGHANVCIAPLVGLPELPVVPLEFDWVRASSHRTWKLPQVAEYVGDRPFAWLDDDLWEDAFDWAARRDAPALMVRVDPAVGLTLEHVATLREWAESLS